MKIKILIISGVAIISLLFINGLFLAYKTTVPSKISPTPTAPTLVLGEKTKKETKFETYTNSDDGYSLNYPESLETTTKENAFFIFTSSLEGSLDISINKVANPTGFSPKQFALSDISSGSPEDLKDEIINIQGVEGYKLSNNQKTTIYFPLYGNVLKIIGVYKGKNSESLKITFDKIVSSFRLLEKSELSNTTGWKTYTNKDAKISFSYPPSFIPDTTDYSKTFKVIYVKKIESPDPFYQIEIRLLENFEKADSERLATTEVDKYPPLKKNITKESIKVGEVDGVKVVGLPGKFQKIDIFVGVQDREYIISLSPYDPVLFPKFYPEATNLFYQFLSTVKFQ